MAEAILMREGKSIKWTADAAYSAGDVVQLRDGRAGVVVNDVASGDLADVYTEGVFKVLKNVTCVVVASQPMFWDHSANVAYIKHVNDRDFYLGCAIEDATSSGTTVSVALNVWPRFNSALENGFNSIPVNTAGFPYVIGSGKGCTMGFSTTAEAQKVDALALIGVAPACEGVFHALVNIVTNSDNAAGDFNIGVSNGTHATSFDSVTEYMSVHVDGASTKLNMQSTDGTTTVAATDTTVTFTAGTPFAVTFDMRDLTDIQVYIDGVNVLPSSVFKLNAASGPLKAVAHFEKTSDDSPGNIVIGYAGIVSAQV